MRTGDKVDPAMAPLGTDDEAAGTPPSREPHQPEKPDTELAQFLERWGPTHPYNVRGKLGLED